MRRNGFTIVELLVVIGLMGMLATISTAGYFAVTRGMAERGVISNATSIIRAAKQRAETDGSPVMLWFYNETTRDASQGQNKEAGDSNTPNGGYTAHGVAVAVRMVSRISFRTGNLLGDEFGDLRNFTVVENESSLKQGRFTSMRLYKMGLPENYSSEPGYTYVFEGVCKYTIFQEDLVTPGGSNNKEMTFYCFKENTARQSTLNVGSWFVGDPYGMEFMVVNLPDGYLFGNNGENYSRNLSDPLKHVQTMTFYPPKAQSGDIQGKSQLDARYTIDLVRQGSSRSFGKTPQDMKSI